ncbi:MAG: rod shape-determining protein MreD [Alteromonas sp.]|jgi:rod shape-determining protein MreD|uniref:Rod shape-determining protein MreD n=1 Tax=Alteromonas genovensis TaxID=471225 RepID=A0A6N9TJ59_9ALTE|nr:MULTISPECIES: rod shape-determining protein MreD [Alteromonas]MAI38836.1 rod shape-determining protein MreD [Alteromonas sp.]NDW15946.1 rod shape-determining protein MreD [Alteromonas genovensis]OUX85104.1 MAG: rod shape-determining protein MreD [Alteromonas sp. TMED35]|tara:strand:- start:7413 stop:7889 length:477 start_codon:yes stop_codon:yes gene_type:complete
MRKRNVIIWGSIIIALVLQIVPLPIQADVYRPDWVLVVLAYWSMALPNRVNVGVAFITGVAMDILVGTTLGIHSLGLSVSIYILAANYQRLRNYSVWQQAIIIGLLSSLYHLLTFWVQHLLTDIYFQVDYLWPVAASMVLWPWVFWLLRKTRRQFSIM